MLPPSLLATARTECRSGKRIDVDTIVYRHEVTHGRNIRNGYGCRLFALDSGQTVAQITQGSVDRSDGLRGYLREIRVLMLLRQLVEQRCIAFAQCVDFVLKCLILHLVEFADDGVGVGRSCIAQSERVLVCRADQRVGLVANGKLAFIALAFDSRADIAAAFCDLGRKLTVAGLNGVDNLLACHADLPGHLVDRSLKIADCTLKLGCRAVQRRCELVDGGTVALNGIHQKFTPGIAVKLCGETVCVVTEAVAAETTPAEEQQNDPDPPATVAAPGSLIVVAVHQRGYEVRVHPLVLHQGRKHRGNAGIATVTEHENIFVHKL